MPRYQHGWSNWVALNQLTGKATQYSWSRPASTQLRLSSTSVWFFGFRWSLSVWCHSLGSLTTSVQLRIRNAKGSEVASHWPLSLCSKCWPTSLLDTLFCPCLTWWYVSSSHWWLATTEGTIKRIIEWTCRFDYFDFHLWVILLIFELA